MTTLSDGDMATEVDAVALKQGRAGQNWRQTATKAKAVGFFARHIADKTAQREILTRYANFYNFMIKFHISKLYYMFERFM